MRQAPSQLPFAAPHLHQHDDHDEDDEDGGDDEDDEEDDHDDAHHLAQPGEVPAHHDLGGVGKEGQDVWPALRVLQSHLQDGTVAVATNLISVIIIIIIIMTMMN